VLRELHVTKVGNFFGCGKKPATNPQQGFICLHPSTKTAKNNEKGTGMPKKVLLLQLTGGCNRAAKST
jgi:hypothetical protein